MTFLFPLVALALALAAPFVLRRERAGLDPLRVGAAVLLFFAAAVVVFRSAPEIDRTPAAVGLAFGVVATLVGSWAGGLAAGVAAASALHLLAPTALPVAGLGLMAGAGLGAMAVGGEVAALAAVAVAMADNLGMRHSDVPASAFVGSQIGLAAAVGAFLAGWVPEKVALAKPVLVGVAALLAGLFVSKSLGESGLTLCAGLGALSGAVLHFLMPDEEGESSRVGLGAVIGIGLATVAFGLGKGMGMALATLAALGVLLAAENRRAVLALGPLVGLVMFRVLREAGTGATRALDIGQHYVLLALVLGLALPLLPTDWLERRGQAAHAAGSLLWGLAAVAAAPLVVVALGMRGGVGFTVGLGVAGLVQAMRTSGPLSPLGARGVPASTRAATEGTPRPSPLPQRGEGALLPLALGAGLGGATILALAWLGDEAVVTRDQKVRLFEYSAAGIAAIAVILALVGRQKSEAAK